ncbi:endonuclease YncB(thermonuclease family) [Kaistia hirudinis]|uniref:Endonuclease YncB(Thermonuclease family) n=1 Tax=Kaistia hirudinis TaxID=1293440 RepID=A0A840AW48_9HYPH|nr:hypothetical protein [Kaistia hirudinis]MBB3933443.1 endonuclease YncB(thermonuclease family) [Kaistia hirudinis]
MRTLLAAILLIVIVTMAAVAASWLTGYVRIEFGDEPPRISAEHPAVIEPPPSEPVADGPLDEAKEPEVEPPIPEKERPAVRIVTPAPVPEVAAGPAPGNPPPDETAEVAPAPAPSAEVDQSAAAPRIVGGPGITPGPFAAPSPLPREAAPPVPEAPDWTTYRRVTIVGAGEIDLGKRRITLAGIAPPPADRQCRLTQQSAERPCAALALLALRQRVRGLGVQCRFAPNAAEDAASADCRIGATDLSLWLIEQGWAEAAADAPAAYGAAEQAARCAAKGLWRGAEPPADCPAR